MNELSKSESWDLVASNYMSTTKKYLSQYSQEALSYIEFGSDWRAVDIACGPGTTSIPLSKMVSHVDSIDFSSNMISYLNKSVEEQGIKNIKAQVADGQSLPFGDEEFNFAVSMFGLMFFPDILKGLKEIQRVLVKGSFGIVASWAPIDRSPFMQMLMGGLRAGNPEIPADGKTNLESLENIDFFEDLLQKAGFNNIKIHRASKDLVVESPDYLWNFMQGGAPVLLLKNSQSKARWKQTQDKAIEYFQENFQPRLTSEALIAVFQN